MKRNFLTITLFSILAILPFAIFAQTASNKCVSGNCVNGRGKMVYANGDIYEGDFVNGKLEGQGTSNFTDRAIYTGQYSKDLFHGKGKYIYPDGGFYDGNWVNGKIEGKGKSVSSDGNIYEGDYVNGKANGQGIFKLKDGRIYTGQFSNDLINGKGKMTYADGGIYEGNWVNGNREGQGTYTAKDGSYASGEWKNDKLNGYGKDYIKATNITREGNYKDHVLVSSAAKNPTFTPTLPYTPSSLKGTQNPFPDCNFVLEDAGCKSFFGFPQFVVYSIIGSSNSEDYATKSYYRYGFGIGYWEKELGYIIFHGIKTDSKFQSAFNGKPSSKFDWGVSPDEVIRKYGKPDSKDSYKNEIWGSENYGAKIIEFDYGKNTLRFQNKKLVSVELKATEAELANYRALATAANKWMDAALKQHKERKYEDAIKSFSECIKLDPFNAASYAFRGRSFEALNRNAEALADYTNDIQLSHAPWLALIDRGQFFARLGQFENAIADFKKAIEINPKSTEGYVSLGDAYRKFGLLSDKADAYENAIKYYTKYIELNSKNANVYRVRGMAYFVLGKDSEAIADTSKAIELNPKYWEAFELRAAVYCVQGKTALAQADQKKVIELGGTVKSPCK